MNMRVAVVIVCIAAMVVYDVNLWLHDDRKARVKEKDVPEDARERNLSIGEKHQLPRFVE